MFQDPTDLIFSLIKGMVMATVIVLVGCYYGYTASGGPVGVGTATAQRDDQPISMLARSIWSVRAARIGFRSRWRRAPSGEKQFIGHRAEDGAQLHRAPGDKRDRDAEKRATPRTKFAVPSIGSTTHTWSPSSCPLPRPGSDPLGRLRPSGCASSRSTAASASLA